jgi:mono/diheme cytochrome c family protein
MKQISLALGLVLVAGAAPAQEKITSFGQYEYMNSCAQCHGADGTGGGPMAGFLTAGLPDLTQLSVGNGGVFPVRRIYEVIEGSQDIGPHGSREMPAWGGRYQAASDGQMGADIGVSRDVYVRTRILALIEYLDSLQG